MAMPEVMSPTRATIASARTSRTFSRPASAVRPRGSKLDQSGGSILGEGISDAPHRPDVARLRRVRLDLVADVADVHVDRALVLLEGIVVVAHELEQLAAGEDAVGP